jgi:hypothetical protein
MLYFISIVHDYENSIFLPEVILHWLVTNTGNVRLKHSVNVILKYMQYLKIQESGILF